MVASYSPTLPFRVRMWRSLLKALGTTTLSVIVFGMCVPVAAVICASTYSAFHPRRSGVALLVVIRESVVSVPSLISGGITILAWAGLLGWASLRTITNDKKFLFSIITEKENCIQELGEIMGKRDQEHANRVNQDTATIYGLQEKIREIIAERSLIEGQLYDARTQLAKERDRVSQPDVGLVWDWPENERMVRALNRNTEKDILVHNRSNEFIYNVQIEPIELRQGLTFDPINTIAPNTQYRAVGRWNDKSSLTSNYAYFFVGGEEEAQTKGWICKKTHNRGLSDSYYKIPMVVTYEASGVKWRCQFDFIYDVGEDSDFKKKSAQRISVGVDSL